LRNFGARGRQALAYLGATEEKMASNPGTEGKWKGKKVVLSQKKKLHGEAAERLASNQWTVRR